MSDDTSTRFGSVQAVADVQFRKRRDRREVPERRAAWRGGRRDSDLMSGAVIALPQPLDDSFVTILRRYSARI
jgi:hypothetical protein